MVYQHGVGVEPAKGLREEKAPPIQFHSLGRAGLTAIRNASDAVDHAVEHLKKGEVAPWLGERGRSSEERLYPESADGRGGYTIGRSLGGLLAFFFSAVVASWF